MAEDVVLAVGHGSRRPAALVGFHEFADAVAERIGRPVERCFLERAAPDLEQGLEIAAERAGQQARRVIVLPMFLGAAGHFKNEISPAVKEARARFAGVTFLLASPLGVHARLVELADMRVQGTLATAASSIPVSETSLLVVGRGSSDAGANSEIARLAYLMGQAREYLSTGYAFHAVASPGVAQALRLCRLLGARQVVVMPFLLFTGRVHEEIGAMALQCGGELGLRVHVAGYLGTHTLSLDVAGQRIDEAAKGIAAINCDLCRYRFAV